MKLDSLYELNKPGIYALIHPVTKKVYLGYGKSMLKSLTRLIDDLKTNKALSKLKDDYAVLELIICETCAQVSSIAYLRLRLAYHRKLYEDCNSSFYNNDKGLRLRTNIFLGPNQRVYVEVVSQSNKRVIVGVFSRVAEADEFVSRYYSGQIGTVVYADNRLTDRYRQGLTP